MLAELLHATFSVCLLAAFVTALYLLFTDLPVEPFLVGAAIGMPGGVTLLVLTSPKRGR